jgi:hypothetical protein
MCANDCPHFIFKRSIFLLPEEEPGEPAPGLMDEEDELHPTPLVALAPPPLADTSAEGSDGSDVTMDEVEVEDEEEEEQQQQQGEEEDEQQEQEQQQQQQQQQQALYSPPSTSTPETPSTAAITPISSLFSNCTTTSRSSGKKQDLFPSVVRPRLSVDDAGDATSALEVGVRYNALYYCACWLDARAWLIANAQLELFFSASEDEVPATLKVASQYIRDKAWRDANFVKLDERIFAVSSELLRMLARKYGVPDATWGLLDQAVRFLMESTLTTTSRRVRVRAPTSSREVSPSRPSAGAVEREETPRDSGRRKEGRQRGGEQQDDPYIINLDNNPPPSSPPSPPPSSLRAPQPLAAIEDIITEAAAKAREDGAMTPFVKSLALGAGLVHSALRQNERKTFLRSLFRSSALDVTHLGAVPKSVINLALSHRVLDAAVSLVPLLNSVASKKLVRVIVDGFRTSVTLYEASEAGVSGTRTRLRRRNQQQDNASFLGDMFLAINGLGKSTARTSASSFPVPTVRMADRIAAGASTLGDDGADDDDGDDDDESAEAQEDVAKFALAVARLLRVIAPGPTMMAVLLQTEYGTLLRHLHFAQIWDDKERHHVALAFNNLKRRGGMSDVVMSQCAMMIDPILCSAVGAPEGSLVVPRSKEMRKFAEKLPHLFNVPMNDETISATHHHEDDGSGSVRVSLAFALAYDAMAREALYRKVAMHLAKNDRQLDLLYKDAPPPRAPEISVTRANKEAVATWQKFEIDFDKPEEAARWNESVVFVTIHGDAAHLARSRAMVKTIEATSMIAGCLYKAAVVNRTEQSMLFFIVDTGDGADKLEPHLAASSVAVPSIAAQVEKLLRAGIVFPVDVERRVAFRARLLLFAYDLKGVKELLGKLGFGAIMDMPWSEQSRHDVSKYFPDYGLFNYAPISWRYSDAEQVYRLGGKTALRAVSLTSASL